MYVAPPPAAVTPAKGVTSTPAAVTAELADRVKRTPKPRRFHGSPPPPCTGSFDESEDSAVHRNGSARSSVQPEQSSDAGFDKFFSGVTATNRDAGLDCSVGDFDLIVPESEAPLVHHKKAGPISFSFFDRRWSFWTEWLGLSGRPLTISL
jgi:hypothetical protein